MAPAPAPPGRLPGVRGAAALLAAAGIAGLAWAALSGSATAPVPGTGTPGPAASPPPASGGEDGVPSAPAPASRAGLPAASATAPAEAGVAPALVLHARAVPPSPRSGEEVRLEAEFVNLGTAPVEFHVPDWFVDGQVFPDWSLRGPGGAEYVPAEGEGAQSGWTAGVVGEIVRLGPGSSRSFRFEAGRFVRTEDAAREEVPLPPGDWTVSCRYSRPSRKVPWSEEFDAPPVEREIEGLWTGTLESPPFRLPVLPGAAPALVLSAPIPFVPGEACPLEIAVVNNSLEAVDLRGRLVLLSVSIGRLPETVASLVPGDPCLPAEAGCAPVTLRVEASSTRRLRVEFARLPGDWVRGPRGLTLQARFEPEDETDSFSSNRLRVAVRDFPDAGARGLRLRLLREGPASFTAELRNEGEAALRVPRGFAWPADLSLEVRRPGGGGDDSLIPAELPDGRTRFSAQVVRWTVSRGGSRDLGPADFVYLAPGDSMAAAVDLLSAASPRVPEGSYEVRALWRNPENGVRGGLEPGSVVAGALATEWVPVDFPTR